MPLHGRFHIPVNQLLHNMGTHDLFPEPRLLQQFEVSQRRARIYQVLEIWRLGPVSQVREVRDEGGLIEEFLRGEVVEIVWVSEGLDELYLC